LGKVWPQGAKTVWEIQTIAREVLSLDAESVQRNEMLLNNTLSDSSSEQPSPFSQSGSQSSSLDDLLFPDTIEDLASCWDMDNQQLDMNLWFESY
jgi:hypothetical protein